MPFITGEQFRLQIYDDGAGEYIFSSPINNTICSGSTDPIGNSGNAVGPFILPSPIAITKPGLLTVQLSNVNDPNNSDDEPNTVNAYIALVFAVKKRCGSADQSGSRIRRGVLS